MEPTLAVPMPAVPRSERRLVSVLFADLVGFTTLSEARDPEDVRDFLGRYFEHARRLIERYGGVVEKFIGDAVMAVWGAPAAQEDDAELAVRAAFDIVAGVTALGEEFEIPGLQLRAGVATGEAAVDLAADGQGMVAGDLVNTASRIQSVAAPGTVLVDERTRRLSEAAIAYEDTGAHTLKGKAEPVQLWRADRVVALRRGFGRSVGLEPPFVGRDREFRLVRDLFHASADEGRARLASVVGVAGIGKSRLGWEFFKYVDGLADVVWWHSGRCLPYSEGVSYWALAEMVRMRAEIAEEDPPEIARRKLSASVERHVPDPEERAWIEDRVSQLLGLADPSGDREDLFAAWRLFFERLADEAPVVLVFEDLQWADASLLDFIEYVLDWSRAHPVFVLTLARPELADRRPDWGVASRNFTSLYLEPLSDSEIDALLAGLVPGLPEQLTAAIRQRAEGVPLYAVETVRMLLDRGLLVQEGASYQPVGVVDTLAVPESLQALIAARLDGLAADERQLIQQGAVLGKSFSTRALAAVSERTEPEIEPLLAGLVRKEVLTVRTDPRSPDRGQYAFLQGLVQQVARDTLSRRDRKALDLRAAAFLESDWGGDEDEIADVIAAHYLDAYDADRQADDAPESLRRGRALLIRAGDRAEALGGHAEAERHFVLAAGLSHDAREQACLLERAGQAALTAGHVDDAGTHFERAHALAVQLGDERLAARVTARGAEALWGRGLIEEAIEQMETAFATIAKDGASPDLAVLAQQLGRFLVVTGKLDRGFERVEVALEAAESLGRAELLPDALTTKALAMLGRRPEESIGLMKHALELALAHDDAGAAVRALHNLGHAEDERSRHAQAVDYLEQGVALARRRGNRQWEMVGLANLAEALHLLGRFDEAAARLTEIPAEAPLHGMSPTIARWMPTARIAAVRGEAAAARAELRGLQPSRSDLQELVVVRTGEAILARAEDDYHEALAAADEARQRAAEADLRYYEAEAWVEGAEALIGLGEVDAVRERIAELDDRPPVRLSPFLAAQRARIGARVEPDRHGDLLPQAIAGFREIGARFWLAVALLEQAEWLRSDGAAEAAQVPLDEATALFEEMRATPWLARAQALTESIATPAATVESLD